MPTEIIYPEWQDMQSESKYPFADSATLTNGVVTLPKNVFLDARLYPIGGGARQYISAITVSDAGTTISISDESAQVLATGLIDPLAPSVSVMLKDVYDRPAGILVSTEEDLATLLSWPVGAQVFTVDQTEFTATVVEPTPQIGVRGFLVEGKLFSKDVYLLGEQGVYFTKDGEYIRYDVIGDPRAKQRFCEQVLTYTQPWFIRTINGNTPDEYGEFKIASGSHIAGDTVLRIEPDSNSLGFRLIGSPL